MITVAVELLETLRRRGLTLATAESCTGGNVAHLITEIAGCSDVMLGAVVSYCNDVKHNVLGVPVETLAANGAVSEPTVRAMAEGACRVIGADCAVATSGIAGPGGAVSGKPVGTVWMAAHAGQTTIAECRCFSGDRSEVIAQASEYVLGMLLKLVNSL